MNTVKAISFKNAQEINLLVKIIEKHVSTLKTSNEHTSADEIIKIQQLLDTALEVQKMFITSKKSSN